MCRSLRGTVTTACWNTKIKLARIPGGIVLPKYACWQIWALTIVNHIKNKYIGQKDYCLMKNCLSNVTKISNYRDQRDSIVGSMLTLLGADPGSILSTPTPYGFWAHQEWLLSSEPGVSIEHWICSPNQKKKSNYIYVISKVKWRSYGRHSGFLNHTV